MNNLELKRRLHALDFLAEASGEQIDAALLDAVTGWLNHGRVPVRQYWTQARRVLAAKQLICRIDGIEVGAIDGLYGPQTTFAFEVYAARLAGAGPVILPQRSSVDGNGSGGAGPWPRQADVESHYGAKGGNQTRLHLPYAMKLAWDTAKTVRSFYVHEKVHDSALRCFQRVADTYSEQQRVDLGLDQFGGCLNVRRMRGGSAWSMHSWGIAIDFDPVRNPLRANRENARLARPDCEPFWEIWESEGWVSLGRSKDFDWMHVQAARL